MTALVLDTYDYIKVEYVKESYILAAISAHGDQKYGPYPYAFHLAMVEHTLVNYGFTEYKYKAAAWLHDVIEDTGASLSKVNDSFGREVAQIVWACTGEGSNRKERNQDIFNKIAAFPDAAVVKAADRLANVNMGFHTLNLKKLKVYHEEWREFEKNIAPHIFARPNRNGVALWVELSSKMDKVSAILSNPKLVAAITE